MKGPRSRHKFYIAREWECQVCKKRVLTSVQAVNRACVCQGVGQPIWMALIEEQRRPARKPFSATEEAAPNSVVANA